MPRSLLLAAAACVVLVAPALAEQAPAPQRDPLEVPAQSFTPRGPRGYQGGVGWGWFTAAPPLQQCMNAASQAMQQMGLTVDEIGPGETGVVGGKDGDAVVVQCIPQRNVITLVWHGRDNYTTPLFDRMKAILGLPGGNTQAPPSSNPFSQPPQNPGFNQQPQQGNPGQGNPASPFKQFN